MSEQWYLKIGPKGQENALTHYFEVQPELFQRWHKVEFQFKQYSDGFKIYNPSVTPSRYILVKERWYHRLASRIYFKFKKPTCPEFAKE